MRAATARQLAQQGGKPADMGGGEGAAADDIPFPLRFRGRNVATRGNVYVVAAR